MFEILLWGYKYHFPANKHRLQTQRKKAGQGGMHLLQRKQFYSQKIHARDVQPPAPLLPPINLSPKQQVNLVCWQRWDQ